MIPGIITAFGNSPDLHLAQYGVTPATHELQKLQNHHIASNKLI
jgi:hypothetical protein